MLFESNQAVIPSFRQFTAVITQISPAFPRLRSQSGEQTKYTRLRAAVWCAGRG